LPLSLFIGHIGVLLTEKWPRLRTMLVVSFLSYFLAFALYNGCCVYQALGLQQSHLNYLRSLKIVKKNGGRVIADPPFRPIDEHNVFYSLGSFTKDLEVIMTEKMDSKYRERFTEDYYWQELQREPPALIIQLNNQTSPPAVRKVVSAYLYKHKADYRQKRIRVHDVFEILCWVHKDYDRP
jgi:hypothetical protein